MTGLAPALRRAATFIGIVGLGLGTYAWLVSAGQQPRKRPRRDMGQPVRVLAVAEYAAVPHVTGYGPVAAQQTWQGVAEVGGRVLEVDEHVQVGRRVRKGTVLYKIDPEDLELEKSRSVASVKGVRAQIAELKVQESNTRASLAVEEKTLQLARKDLERAQSLFKSGALPQSEVDTAEKTVLTSEKAVVGLKNTLAELPASRRVLEAQLEDVEAGVTGAERSIQRAEIVAPFTMQISEVTAGVGQAVSSGQVLVSGEGLDVVEVTAQLPVGAIDPLLPERPRRGRRSPSPDAQPADEGSDAPGDVLAAPHDTPPPADDPTPPGNGQRPGGGWFSSIADSLHATVHLETQAVTASWPARFARFAGIDPTTRTLGVVVQVDRQQRRQAANDVRLSPGLHVAVDFEGQPKPGCLAVPSEALHGSVLYVVGADDELELREVELAWGQEEFSCVQSGIAAGDRVVLSELTPAVAGMLLDPTEDDRDAERIAKLVLGESSAP